jgi:hypothetical protein
VKKLYLPLLFDEQTHVASGGKTTIFCTEAFYAFSDMEKAREEAKRLSLKNPQGKVVILESIVVIEARRVEFAEKMYNEHGELIA